MKMTVIGAGNMGPAFVRQLTRAGHEVSVTGRDSAKLADVARANPGASAAAPAGAAKHADAVVLATDNADAVEALTGARHLEPLAGVNLHLGHGAGLGTGIAPTWIGRN